MSFGFAVSDFITIGQLAWAVYKACKSAPGEFQGLARELSALHTTLHELEDEAKAPTSLLNRRDSDRKPELDSSLANLSTTPKQIKDIVERYHSWQGPEANLGSGHVRNRELGGSAVQVAIPYYFHKLIYRYLVCWVFV